MAAPVPTGPPRGAPPRPAPRLAPVPPPLPLSIFGLPEWADRLLQAGIVVLVALVALWLLRRAFARLLARGAGRPLEPGRARQRQTAISLFATALRYVVLVMAAIGVVVALTGGGGPAALGGTALLAVIIGFAFQRLLTDVIAGTFILFEGQYGVGDLVALKPMDFTGVVEEVGLRATVLRDLNGDLLFVPNGQITGARRLPQRNRTLAVEIIARDPGAVEQALAEAARVGAVRGARFATAPHVTARTDLGDGLVALRVRASVAPSLEWLVRDLLVGLLDARAGDAMVRPPMVIDTDPEVVRPYQEALGGEV